jgi:hypothetical protein
MITMARTNGPKILSTYNKTNSGTPRTTITKTPVYSTTPVKKSVNVAPVKSAPTTPGRGGAKKITATPIGNTTTPIKRGANITPVKGAASPVRGGSSVTPKLSRGTIKPIEGIPVPKNPTPVKAAKKK